VTTGGAEPFDLAHTFVHLGLGSTATPLPDFEWSVEYVEAYRSRVAPDGREGRLVCIIAQDATWDGWERHPSGEEVVYLLSGRVDIVQDLDGAHHVVELRPGEAMINPTNVWHTARVHEPGSALFITPGDGTEHRPL
jgi:mannose-6-phosphate isomerase-like protein (cupin superfamily)